MNTQKPWPLRMTAGERVQELQSELAQLTAEVQHWKDESEGWKESEGQCDKWYNVLHDENEASKAQAARYKSGLEKVLLAESPMDMYEAAQDALTEEPDA